MPRPNLEIVERIAAALGWPINAVGRLLGYPGSDNNLSLLHYLLALDGCKELSEQGREMVGKQIARIIEFVSQCGQAVETLVVTKFRKSSWMN
jgi:hypothetical protein